MGAHANRFLKIKKMRNNFNSSITEAGALGFLRFLPITIYYKVIWCRCKSLISHRYLRYRKSLENKAEKTGGTWCATYAFKFPFFLLHVGV